MKSKSWFLLLMFLAFAAASAVAQCNQPVQFCHIIIVIQENRTPDDLFGGNLTFENGVDLASGGYGYWYSSLNKITEYGLIQDTPRDLTGCVPGDPSDCKNPGHEQSDWVSDYHAGNMDGFCHEYAQSGTCPSYSYVPQADALPYFAIAENYGFANYMF